MYFLDFEDFEIAGASPETLVTVTGRTVRQRPIAGTRPRADSVEQDLQQARDLLADPKERAEHVMLVDLGRNDLGRVCEYGSVSVDELMVVETYSHVIHIVSSVAGTLREDVSAVNALRSVLPAGTLSGAPKVRARSTSITCSARSFSSAMSSASSRLSSVAFAPRRRVPAIGRTSTVPSASRTSTSGDEPAIWKSPKSR